MATLPADHCYPTKQAGLLGRGLLGIGERYQLFDSSTCGQTDSQGSNPGVSLWLEQTDLCREHNWAPWGKAGICQRSASFSFDRLTFTAPVSCGWDDRLDNRKNTPSDNKQAAVAVMPLGVGFPKWVSWE